jgi:hypothetical protein
MIQIDVPSPTLRPSERDLSMPLPREFLAHHGPTYLATDVSRSKGVPFAILNKHAWESYATQTDPQLDYFVNMPDHLVLAKSLVTSSSVEADVWDGIDSTSISYMPPPGYRPSARSSVSLELGGPWAFLSAVLCCTRTNQCA